ncbi:MAG TPA: hypothetical protein VNA27_11555 [Rubrobacteraceae bacterium]|nr:hypothetical protein [Rubrobacteraceae bacterium]
MIREPSFEAEQAEVYGEAIDALNRAGIRYMLGGALALHAYTGIWRDTKDLDIFVPGGVVEQVLEKFKTALRWPSMGMRTPVVSRGGPLGASRSSTSVSRSLSNQGSDTPITSLRFED